MDQGMHASFQMDWVFFHTPESLGRFFQNGPFWKPEVHDWVVVSFFLIFFPTWGNDPIWLIFFKRVLKPPTRWWCLLSFYIRYIYINNKIWGCYLYILPGFAIPRNSWSKEWHLVVEPFELLQSVIVTSQWSSDARNVCEETQRSERSQGGESDTPWKTLKWQWKNQEFQAHLL